MSKPTYNMRMEKSLPYLVNRGTVTTSALSGEKIPTARQQRQLARKKAKKSKVPQK